MDRIQKDFERFHAENPQVYLYWRLFTRQMIERGLQTGSAAMVAERIRWETTVATKGEVVKLNNNYRSRYARLWMKENPDHGDFFRTRKLRPHSLNSVNLGEEG